MTDGWLGGDGAQEANDVFASAYDDFNYRYQNTQWTERLLQRARAAGLREDQDHLLDVACGTGLSLIPMLRRGFAVTGCDISKEMLDKARAKVETAARLEQADMRDLPRFGSFDLVWAINDPVNYLLSDAELRAALRGMAQNLRSDGVLLFDVNTVHTYRTFFAERFEVKVRKRHMVWSGRNDATTFEAGEFAEARFEVIGEKGTTHVHRQRHFPQAQVLAAISAVDLRCVDVFGVSEPDGEFSQPLDEEAHTKAVYLCVPR
jgi:predicted TPR repeat methyltransferase